jgi:tetratricopeptide (TPR) repeat protein
VSALIPQFYFDFLRGGSPAPITGVVKHNQMDLRGLAALFSKITTLLSEPGASGETESLDLFGLSRFLQRRGEADLAHSACSQALEIGLPAEFRPKACRELALMAKRRGEHDRAAEIWREIVADPQDGIYACEQLAIYFERHAKDFHRAAEFAQLALARLRRQRSVSRDPYFAARCRRLEQKFLHRIARLQHQMRISDGLAKAFAFSRSTGEPEADRRCRRR